MNGATLVLLRKEEVLDLGKLAGIIREQGVTVFFLTTALFNTLIEAAPEALGGIRKVLFGGERVSVEHTRKALEALGPGKIVHVYGPTETTVYATYHPVDAIEEGAGTIPIGKPLANTTAYIVDKQGKPQPIGVVGELWVGGEGVARGYLKREELTKEKFILSPFKAGERLYKTGDLARWLKDGSIEFIGRVDEQVKVRGFRIELGEIEARLLQHGHVKEAVVIAREREGGKELVAYLVGEGTLEVREIKEYLGTSLPEYMVPAHFLQLEKFPLNPSGKVDKKALPEPEGGGGEYTAPENEIQEKLARIWSEVLKVEKVGIHDNFFELGGHSLKATLVAARIHKEFNVVLPLKEIFEKPTIRTLSEAVEKAQESLYTGIAPAGASPASSRSTACLAAFLAK